MPDRAQFELSQASWITSWVMTTEPNWVAMAGAYRLSEEEMVGYTEIDPATGRVTIHEFEEPDA